MACSVPSLAKSFARWRRTLNGRAGSNSSAMSLVVVGSELKLVGGFNRPSLASKGDGWGVAVSDAPPTAVVLALGFPVEPGRHKGKKLPTAAKTTRSHPRGGILLFRLCCPVAMV